MPIYVYDCEQCGSRFEYMQSMSDPPKTECEKCAGKLTRVIFAPAFHLKGGGWYKDLYSSTKKGGESSSSSSGGGETKTESSKPAAESTSSTKKEDKS